MFTIWTDATMFDTTDIRGLRATLDCIPVAMFATERPGQDAAFRYLCINRQYEDETQLSNVNLAGLRPLDVLPPSQGEAVESRYAFSCRKQQVISYTETLHLNGRETRWHTVIYPVRVKESRDRIIGCAFALSPDGRFPAAMPFIDTAMEGLRAEPAMPLPHAVPMPGPSSPDVRPAAKVVELVRPGANKVQAFREAQALFKHERALVT